MRPRIVAAFAMRELRAAASARWFLVGAGALGLLAIAVAQLGMADAARWGVSAFDRTSASLLNLVLLFVPLLALPVGASSFATEMEDGTLAYLVAQPVARGEIVLGKLLGLIAAMSLTITLGFGAAAVVVGARGGVPSSTYLVLVLGAWLLSVVMVSLGALLSLVARTRVRATTAAIATWVTLTFLCDFGVLAAAAAQTFGPQGLFCLSIANPLQAVKTLIALFVSARLEILGPVGVHAVRVFGRGGLAAVLAGSIACWTLLATVGSVMVFRRRELT